jgi:hypothetical protein
VSLNQGFKRNHVARISCPSQLVGPLSGIGADVEDQVHLIGIQEKRQPRVLGSQWVQPPHIQANLFRQLPGRLFDCR